MRGIVAVGFVGLLFAGCATAGLEKLPQMGVDFAFEQRHKCGGVSPEIRLTNVPQGIARYEIKMTDLDVPSFRHWSETLAATEPVIREAAGHGYYGPCPPSGTHRYSLEVVGRDARNTPIAYGEKTAIVGR
jgi:phosphatidylethanolamine-binding protein (PEBP) family uncharacterized protein